METFVETCSLPRLNHDGIENLNRPVTRDCLSNQQSPKNSLVPSGLTGEFYHRFKENLKPIKTLQKNQRGENILKLVFQIQHYPDAKAR